MPDTRLPPTRRVSAATLWIGRAGRWMHYNITRDNLIDALKTLASVGPLTILIWIYAEREGVRQEHDVSISIEVRCSDPRRIVALKKPYPDKSVVADLEGPPSMLDTVVERLERQTGDQPAVEIQVDPHFDPGTVQEIDTRDALANNSLFRGITINDCRPTKLEVSVDEIEEKELEVQVPASITNLVSPPVFTPRTVKIRGPRESIDALANQHRLVAEADLGSIDAMNMPGPHDFKVVRIIPLDDPNLSFDPPSVDAAVSVRESDVTGIILSVPIWPSSPPDDFGAYRVHILSPEGGALKNVKVTGAADTIAKVNQPEFQPKPHADLEIHDDDEAGKTLERAATFRMFQELGLHVSEEVSQRPVEFTLEKAKSSGNE